jgi:hypothetical protein
MCFVVLIFVSSLPSSSFQAAEYEAAIAWSMAAAFNRVTISPMVAVL